MFKRAFWLAFLVKAMNPKTLANIEDAIERGAKYKAVQSLRSGIAGDYANLPLRNRLAELYYQAGFLDAAGLYWLLCEPTEPYMQHAIDIYLQSVNHSAQQVLADLALHSQSRGLSDYAKQQLIQLEQGKLEQNRLANIKSTQQKADKSVGNEGNVTLLLITILTVFCLFILGVGNGIYIVIQWLIRLG